MADAVTDYRNAQCLQYGLGVDMDEDGAVALYRRAADRGFAPAQFSLGEIFKEGRIVPQDLVAAYGWFARVARSDSDLAPAAREACATLEEYLTRDQLAEALAWSDEQLPALPPEV